MPLSDNLSEAAMINTSSLPIIGQFVESVKVEEAIPSQLLPIPPVPKFILAAN
jgi:hypothetical protein